MENGEESVDDVTCAMGLSLGEYSALCFAGAISFEDGVKITKVRGEAMQAASDAVDSGMVSVIGLDSTKTSELCAKASEMSGEKVRTGVKRNSVATQNNSTFLCSLPSHRLPSPTTFAMGTMLSVEVARPARLLHQSPSLTLGLG